MSSVSSEVCTSDGGKVFVILVEMQFLIINRVLVCKAMEDTEEDSEVDMEDMAMEAMATEDMASVVVTDTVTEDTDSEVTAIITVSVYFKL